MGQINHIFLDGSRALQPEPTGIERYNLEIVRSLIELPQAKDHRWTILLPSSPPADHPFGDLPAHARTEIIPQRRFWTLYGLSKYFGGLGQAALEESVLYVPSHTLPLVRPPRSLMMIHDLATLALPGFFPLAERLKSRVEIIRNIYQASRILVPTKATRQDLIKKFPNKKRTTHVVYHGIDHLTSRIVSHLPPKLQDLKTKKYLLTVGRVELRKNTGRIVEAFSRLPYAEQYHLVLIGKPGYGYESFRSIVRALPAASRRRIHELGYQPDSVYRSLLMGAAAFVFPSLYEGFGFPVLEAMAAGIPTVTSNEGALAEVAGPAAEAVDPWNIDSIVAGILRALEPKRGEELTKLGLTHAQTFRWRTTAEQTYQLLTRD